MSTIKKIGVIIPYRNRFESLTMLAKQIRATDKETIEFLLVSLGDTDPRVEHLCSESGIQYHYENYDGIFKIGLAHNIGAKILTSLYIMKLDVDVLPHAGFFEKVLQLSDEHLACFEDYLVIGCVFAGKSYTEQHLQDIVMCEHVDELLGNPELRERHHFKHPEGTMFIMNRLFYLSFGGCSEQFEGHGWEDYQVIYCAAKTKNKTLQLVDYLPGTIRRSLVFPENQKAAKLGLVLIHAWHEQHKSTAYHQRKQQNARILWNLTLEYARMIDARRG